MHERSEADAEAWVLATAEGQSLLADVCAVARPGPAELARWRASVSPDRVSAALWIRDGRRRGAAKFTRADRMWLEPTGLEQATAEPVARHKARRFDCQRVVDLCCGIGGDTVALAATSQVVAVDLDPGMCRRVSWNARVHDVAERVLAVRGRAEGFPIPSGSWVHIDPDRRRMPAGRARRIHGYEPGLDFLQDLIRATPAGAIKLGPASDFEAHFSDPSLEVELISLNGECKEATVWHGALATCRRRATCLPEGSTWTDRDGSGSAHAAVGPVLGWVFDPDPALLRSGLIDGFASHHGLTRFVAGTDYLTAGERTDLPFLSAFQVIEELPLDMKTLRREIAVRGIGSLEIKVRGVEIKPEAVRAALKPRGGETGTLLIAGCPWSLPGRGAATVILAKRWAFGSARGLD